MEGGVIQRFSGRMKRAILAVIFITLNLACLWIYHHYSRLQSSEPPTASILAYGASATPLLNLIAPDARSRGEHRWRLILYFGDSSHRQAIPKAKYTQILFDRFHAHGLDVVGVVAGKFPELEKLVERQLISYPLIRDADLTIAQALGVPTEVDGCFFVDPDNTIRFFTTNLFDPEDLRQLTEKFLLGEVTYPESGAEVPLQEGAPMPELTLLRIDDWQPEHLGQAESRQRLLIIFTATCPACRLSSYLSDYARMKDQWPRRPWVIFNQNFSRDEILVEAARRGIDTSHFYLASGALSGIEDPYYGTTLGGSDLFVIETNQIGRIKRIESWEQLTTGLAGGESP